MNRAGALLLAVVITSLSMLRWAFIDPSAVSMMRSAKARGRLSAARVVAHRQRAWQAAALPSPAETLAMAKPAETAKSVVATTDSRAAVATTRSRAATVGVTLVSQCSRDHLHSIRAIANVWAGPLVVAVHVPAGRWWREKNGLGDDLADVLLAGQQPHRLTLVYLQSSDVHVSGHTPGSYPINALRNAAIASVRTSHLFICDIDFLPSVDLYYSLLGLVLSRTHGENAAAADPAVQQATERVSEAEREVMRSPSAAIVVPAFKLKGKCREPQAGMPAGLRRAKLQEKCFEHYLPRVPRHSSALKKCIELGMCEQFCPTCHTHGSTDYAAWWSQAVQLRRITCFDSMRYEPYVMLELTEGLPPFDEHFFGYGKNKIQFIAHLQHAGFTFHVLRSSFVIHVPHYPSVDKDEWAHAMKETPHEAVNWHVRFLQYIRRLYPNYTLPRCSQFYAFM